VDSPIEINTPTYIPIEVESSYAKIAIWNRDAINYEGENETIIKKNYKVLKQ
jgi:hypothetical protein